MQGQQQQQVTLIVDWKYEAYGTRKKRNIEFPVTHRGSLRTTYILEKGIPIKEQIARLKLYLIDEIKMRNRPQVYECWLSEAEAEDSKYPEDVEKLGYETVKISNVREATIWSELEDY